MTTTKKKLVYNGGEIEGLRRQVTQLLAITDVAPVFLSYVDRDQRYRANNRAYTKWFGRPRSTFTGKTLLNVLGSTGYAQARDNVEIALSGRRVPFDMTLRDPAGGAHPPLIKTAGNQFPAGSGCKSSRT